MGRTCPTPWCQMVPSDRGRQKWGEVEWGGRREEGTGTLLSSQGDDLCGHRRRREQRWQRPWGRKHPVCPRAEKANTVIPPPPESCLSWQPGFGAQEAHSRFALNFLSLSINYLAGRLLVERTPRTPMAILPARGHSPGQDLLSPDWGTLDGTKDIPRSARGLAELRGKLGGTGVPWAGGGGLPGCQGKLPTHPELHFYAYKMGGRGEGGFPGNSNQIKSNVGSDAPLRGCYNLPPRGGVHERLNYIQSRVGAAFSPGRTTHILKGMTPQSGSFGSLNTKCKTASYPTNSPTNQVGTEPGSEGVGPGRRQRTPGPLLATPPGGTNPRESLTPAHQQTRCRSGREKLWEHRDCHEEGSVTYYRYYGHYTQAAAKGQNVSPCTDAQRPKLSEEARSQIFM